MSTKRTYRYRVVDVFTTHALEGNALAVIPDAADIDDITMQRVAREFNLAETSFVKPATRNDCAAALRIFTPAREVPFAGHPTVGTSFVLRDEGRVPNAAAFVLEERIGPVPIRVDEGDPPLIWLTTPPISFGQFYEPSVCARAIGLAPDDLLKVAPQLVSAGNPGIFIPLRDKAAVDRAWLGSDGLALLKASADDNLLVFVFTPTPEGAYSRMFAPEHRRHRRPGDRECDRPAGRLHDGARSRGDRIRHSFCERARDQDGTAQHLARTHPWRAW